MSKTKIYLFCSAFLFLLSSPAAADRKLNLDDFVRSAMDNNHYLSASRSRAAAAAGARSEALGGFFPSFSLSARASYTDTVPEMEFVMPVMADLTTGLLIYEEMAVEMGQKENYSAQLQLRQPIFTFGMVSGSYGISSRAHLMELASYRRHQDKIAGEVTKLYYGFLLAGEMSEIARKQKELMQDNLEITRRLYNAGKISNLDVNRVRSHLLSAEAGLAEAEASLKQARAALFNTAVIEDKGQEVVGRLEYSGFDSCLEELLRAAAERRSELEIARLNVGVAQKSRTVELARNLPQLYGFASYNFDRPFQMRDEWGQSWVVGGMIEFPFPAASMPGKIKRVNAQIMQARSEMENIKKIINLEVENSYIDTVRLYEKIEIMKEILDINSQNLDIARSQYEKGLFTTSLVQTTFKQF